MANSYGAPTAQGSNDGTTADNAYAFSSLSSAESDGWVDNAFTFEQEPQTKSEAIRATFLYELDNMEINLKLFKRIAGNFYPA